MRTSGLRLSLSSGHKIPGWFVGRFSSPPVCMASHSTSQPAPLLRFNWYLLKGRVSLNIQICKTGFFVPFYGVVVFFSGYLPGNFRIVECFIHRSILRHDSNQIRYLIIDNCFFSYPATSIQYPATRIAWTGTTYCLVNFVKSDIPQMRDWFKLSVIEIIRLIPRLDLRLPYQRT